MLNDARYGLIEWINDLAQSLSNLKTPKMDDRVSFLSSEKLITDLVDKINALPEDMPEQNSEWYSAHFLAFDLCIAQLQTAIEHNHQLAFKHLQFLMHYFAEIIRLHQHTLNFWLPALNAFYDCHVDLNDDLQQAYMDLVDQEEDAEYEEHGEHAHLSSIQELLREMHDLSDFEIAEHLFAQSHAMPSEFFIDLVYDLASLIEGQDVALLFLLHPRAEVRSIVLNVLDKLIYDLTFTSKSLNRLKAIARWSNKEATVVYEKWIKLQRKKGVLYDFSPRENDTSSWLVTEVDGAGSQGVFVTQCMGGRKYKVAGLLFKRDVGIKDVWLTPVLTKKQAHDYLKDSLDVSVHLRPMQSEDIQFLIRHFIAILVKRSEVPPIRLLELQENLGLEFIPEVINIPALLNKIIIDFHPFTEDTVQDAIQHTKSWMKTKSIVQSWFEEDLNIDQLVNVNCTIVKGVKVCAIDEATDSILENVIEKHRSHWIFHFLWTSLWAKSSAKKTERFWKDCVLVAHALAQGLPMNNIPIMKAIALQTVMNSLETMHERKAHISISKY